MAALVLPVLMMKASPASTLVGPATSLLVFVLAFNALHGPRKRWIYWALAVGAVLVAALWGIGVAAALARQAPNSAIIMTVGYVVPAMLVAGGLFSRAASVC